MTRKQGLFHLTMPPAPRRYSKFLPFQGHPSTIFLESYNRKGCCRALTTSLFMHGEPLGIYPLGTFPSLVPCPDIGQARMPPCPKEPSLSSLKKEGKHDSSSYLDYLISPPRVCSLLPRGSRGRYGYQIYTNTNGLQEPRTTVFCNSEKESIDLNSSGSFQILPGLGLCVQGEFGGILKVF